ncbi:MAG: ATP-binding protein [Acidihalobacter sp.]
MPHSKALAPDQLYRVCDLSQLDFGTTAELEPLAGPLGQERALEALNFGVGMRHEGYNLFVMGSPGLGKQTLLKQLLEGEAAKGAVPSDWCYVNNFDVPHRPQALALPAGRGVELRADMERLLDELLHAVPAAFQSDEYRIRAQEITDDYKGREESAFAELNEQAEAQGIAILRTPVGFTLAPRRDGEVLGPDEFKKLDESEREAIETSVRELNEKLKGVFHRIAAWQKESRERFRELNREVSDAAVGQLLHGLEEKYAASPQVLEFLNAVKQDVAENVDVFRRAGEEEEQPQAQQLHDHELLQRYRVNVLVDNAEANGAPVVHEDNPNYHNLVGRVEHIAQMGALVTNFSLIKAGALHRANGGYLVLDARKVLTTPFGWEGIKRALRTREIRIESLERMLSLVSTISLEPEPIPLDLKVVLSGDRLLYYLLKAYDPEFGQLFKVLADFSEDTPRTDENTQLYARLIASLQQRDGLRPLAREAVGRAIEHAARRADDSERLSVHLGDVSDLLREADYWAGQAGREVVAADDVRRARDARVRRANQTEERLRDATLRETLLIDTQGARTAQVNGLAVLQLGDYAFGRPSRITATARLGQGGVVDIEREAKLGGKLHSKGVMILSAFLADRYARNQPLSLVASLVFEQSYGTIDGDSASTAELCVLLSALADVPIRQSLAITGSVNQHGQVQAIGGVNEKIEGFFDLCAVRGLNGEQGVIIPAANVKHLMLNEEVVEAVRAGQFHVYAVGHVDEALNLLTGLESGEADVDGRYPPDSVNGRVQKRVEELAALRKHYAQSGRENRPIVENGDDGAA